MINDRPLIGLTGRVARGSQFAGMPANFADASIDMYVSAYAAAVADAGGLPVHLPQAVDVDEYRGVLDGVLLSGGADIDPARYGARPEAELHGPEPERDAMELDVIDLAVADDVPVLGICRGFQLLNVHGGGTLHQHVPDHARFDLAPGAETDTVVITPGSRLHDLYGPKVAVNSLHHQTIDRLAEGWEVVGRSGDGTIEAIELPDRDAIAVQWHPEMLAGAASDPIFAWLVEAASRRRRQRSTRR
jgi:putative glutamine amidotransferase